MCPRARFRVCAGIRVCILNRKDILMRVSVIYGPRNKDRAHTCALVIY
jgi:hypothetical protein